MEAEKEINVKKILPIEDILRIHEKEMARINGKAKKKSGVQFARKVKVAQIMDLLTKGA